jgi:hypothetical protein
VRCGRRRGAREGYRETCVPGEGSNERVEPTEHEDKGGDDVNRFFVEAFWLARKEVKRAWLSYFLTGLFVLFPGLFVAVSLSGVFEFEGFGVGGQRMEGYYNAFFSDCLFLLVCAFLGVNAISRDYTPVWRDTFSSRLLFLRYLPIPAGSLVGSRALCMLFALVLGAPALFLPAYFLTDLGELGASYLPFCGVWIGYSLLASGLCLLFEFTLSGRVYALISSGFAASLIAALALLEWMVNLSLVERTAHLVQSYGALPAIFSILAGGAAFALFSRLTTRRLEKRDFSA